MSNLFHEILYRPLFNALIFLYQHITLADLGLAIILLTVIIRFILLPLFYKSFKNQTIMQKLQPEIQKIQHDHKDNREKQAQALMALYKEHKVNPFSGFLMIFIQLPILIALYRVFITGLSDESLSDLYSFMVAPMHIDPLFLGGIDLAMPSMLIVVLAAIFQYWQGKISLAKVDKNKKDQPKSIAVSMGRQMVFIGPLLTFIILRGLPAAVGLYWLTTSIFSICQQYYINKQVYGNNSGENKKIS
ncbi:MAG: YidC/Oxa1 family membrane protein insertase [bacterium]|nr:YidC/Oxa1 family membrane protein insertase [bacterium]